MVTVTSTKLHTVTSQMTTNVVRVRSFRFSWWQLWRIPSSRARLTNMQPSVTRIISVIQLKKY